MQNAILIFENVSLGILALLIMMIFVCIYMLVKNDITFKNHRIIDNAILKYQLHCIAKKIPFEVDYGDVEDYDTTLYRFWDWGYTRLLPKEKFELIKPFIKK